MRRSKPTPPPLNKPAHLPIVDNVASATIRTIPIYEEVYQRGRGDIAQFAKDFLDVELHPGQIEWLHTRPWAIERYLAAANRWGKAVRDDESVLTPEGWRKMGDMEVGDTVFSQDGTECKVTGVFPQGKRPCYRLLFDDGAEIVASDEHLWQVKTPTARFKKNHPQYGQPSVLTTREILDIAGPNPKPPQRVTIPVVEPIQFAHKDVPLEPYALGLMLGNGGMTTSISYTTQDEETVDVLQEAGLSVRAGYRHHFGVSHALPILRSLGLHGCHAWEKFIPQSYLWNDVETRLAVLQGLMDTDGNIEPDSGKMEYVTTSEQLAKDVLFIVYSLGGKGNISTKVPYFTYKDERKEGRLAYRVRFRVHDICPFRIERKAQHWRLKSFTKERVLVRIDDVGEHECTCITVNHPSRLFVAKDFIVTHNSYAAAVKLLHHAFYQTRDEKYVSMKDHYIAINLSITVEQANIVWNIAYNLAKRSRRFGAFLLEDETRLQPFPKMTIGWGAGADAVRSIIWARSSTKEATYLLGMDFDFVNWDEAAREPEGKKVMDDVLRMRLVDRDGRIDCTSTGDGRNWYYGEFMKALEATQKGTRPTIYARTGPAFENPNISHARVRANMTHMTKEMVEQNIYGGFAGSDSVFNREKLKLCYKDCDWHLAHSPSEIQWRKGASYGGGVDFGTNDETVVMIYEEHPAGFDTADDTHSSDLNRGKQFFHPTLYGPRLVYVQAWRREEWQVVWDTIANISDRYHRPYLVIDATSQQGNIHTEMLTARGVNVFPYAFSGSKNQKEHLITLGQQYVEQAIIHWPFVPELYDQLAMYDREDKKLATDWAFAYMLMCECHHRQLEVVDTIVLSIPTTPMTLSRRFTADDSIAGHHHWDGPTEYWPLPQVPTTIGVPQDAIPS